MSDASLGAEAPLPPPPPAPEALSVKASGFNPWKALNPIMQRVRRAGGISIPVPPLPEGHVPDGPSGSTTNLEGSAEESGLARSSSVARLPSMARPAPSPPSEPLGIASAPVGSARQTFCRRPMMMRRLRSEPASQDLPPQSARGSDAEMPAVGESMPTPPTSARARRPPFRGRQSGAGHYSQSPEIRRRGSPLPLQGVVSRSAPAAPAGVGHEGEAVGSGSVASAGQGRQTVAPLDQADPVSSKTREMIEVQGLALRLLRTIFGSALTEEAATAVIDQHPELGWLAICLQRSPLPPSWTSWQDGDTTRYKHSVTGETTEVPPHMDLYVQFASLMMKWRKKESTPKEVAAALRLAHEKQLQDSVDARRVFTGPLGDDLNGKKYWQNLDDPVVVSWVEPGGCADFAARAALRLMQALPKAETSQGSSSSSSSSSTAPACSGGSSSSSSSGASSTTGRGGEPQQQSSETMVATGRRPSSKGRSRSVPPSTSKDSDGGDDREHEASMRPVTSHDCTSRRAQEDEEPDQEHGGSSCGSSSGVAPAVEASVCPPQAPVSRPPSSRGRPTSRRGAASVASAASTTPAQERTYATSSGSPKMSIGKVEPGNAAKDGGAAGVSSKAGAEEVREPATENEESGGGACAEEVLDTTAGLQTLGGTAMVFQVCQNIVSAAVDEVLSPRSNASADPNLEDSGMDSTISSKRSRDLSPPRPSSRSPSLMSVHSRSQVQSPSIMLVVEALSSCNQGHCLSGEEAEELQPAILNFESEPKTPERRPRQRRARPVRCGAPQPLSARGVKEQADVEAVLFPATAPSSSPTPRRGAKLSARGRRRLAAGGA